MTKRVQKSNFKKSYKLRGGDICADFDKEYKEYMVTYNTEKNNISNLSKTMNKLNNMLEKGSINSLTDLDKKGYNSANNFEKLKIRLEIYDTVLLDAIGLIKNALDTLKSTSTGTLSGGKRFEKYMSEALHILNGGAFISNEEIIQEYGLNVCKDGQANCKSYNLGESEVKIPQHMCTDVGNPEMNCPKQCVKVNNNGVHLCLPKKKGAGNSQLSQGDATNSQEVDAGNESADDTFDLEAEIAKIGQAFDEKSFKRVDKFLLDNYQHTCFTPLEELIVMVDQTIDDSIKGISKIFNNIINILPRVQNDIFVRVNTRLETIMPLLKRCSINCVEALTQSQKDAECAKITCISKKYTLDDDDDVVFGECDDDDDKCNNIREMCGLTDGMPLRKKQKTVCTNEPDEADSGKQVIDLTKIVAAKVAVDKMNTNVAEVRKNNPLGKDDKGNEICFPKCSIDENGLWKGQKTCTSVIGERTARDKWNALYSNTSFLDNSRVEPTKLLDETLCSDALEYVQQIRESRATSK